MEALVRFQAKNLSEVGKYYRATISAESIAQESQLWQLHRIIKGISTGNQKQKQHNFIISLFVSGFDNRDIYLNCVNHKRALQPATQRDTVVVASALTDQKYNNDKITFIE